MIKITNVVEEPWMNGDVKSYEGTYWLGYRKESYGHYLKLPISISVLISYHKLGYKGTLWTTMDTAHLTVEEV